MISPEQFQILHTERISKAAQEGVDEEGKE